MELKRELAEAVANDFIYDDGETFQCLSCSAFGEFAGNIKHTSACIVPKANLFLNELDNGD